MIAAGNKNASSRSSQSRLMSS